MIRSAWALRLKCIAISSALKGFLRPLSVRYCNFDLKLVAKKRCDKFRNVRGKT